MTKWEYLNFSRVAGAWSDDKFDGRSPQQKLTDFGKEGWELVSVCYDNAGYNYFLKRPLETKGKAPAKKPAAKSTKK